jgi:anti-sigma factor RsiW
VSSTPEHIPFIHLVDLAEGRLAPAEQSQARAHVAGCPGCAAQLAWLVRIIGLMRTDNGQDPPLHVLARAKRLFRPPAGASHSGPQRHLRATLRFDSARMPQATGMRSAGPPNRQMLFTAAEYDIDLRIASVGTMWALSGQVLGPNSYDQAEAQSPGREIELRGPNGTTQIPLNDLSEFILPPIPSGSYTIILRLNALNIEIDELEIGA